MAKRAWAIAAVGILVGCGPKVTEVRTASYPPREENCSLEFVKVDMADVSSKDGTWEMIGQIVLQGLGEQDPFAEEARAIVRPRACAMGGDAVGLVLHATNQGALSSGTAISYGVLKKRGGPPPEPQTF
jgi:hypothetical protein